MANELGSNAFFRGRDRRRQLQLAVSALVAVAIVGLLVAVARPVLQGKDLPIVLSPRYVSVIKAGKLQVCRVAPRRVICPPVSGSLSESYSASRSYSESASESASKSYSPSNSVSTSTSLSASVHTQ